MGYIPSYTIAFIMVFITMICWGSWANAMKKCGNWRFESFYIDYVIGLTLMMFFLAISLGSVTKLGWQPLSFFHSISSGNPSSYFWSSFAGAMLGVGNMFFIAAIALAGISIAFPLSIGLAVVIGTSLAYITNPSATSHPIYLFIGLGLITIAILANAAAYRIKERGNKGENVKRGIILSIICGVVIGLYAFPLNYAFKEGLNAYSSTIFVPVGFILATILILPIIMKKPLLPNTQQVTISDYTKAKLSWHKWGLIGGFAFGIGTTFNIIVSNTPSFSVAIAFVLGQCATMIGALWGIFVWKEFKGAPIKSYYFLTIMFVLFILGIISLAKATG